MAISDKPWSSFSQADYTIEQWRRACLVGPSTASDNKGDYHLPVREPDGTLNRNAVHAAAGRVHEFQGNKGAAAKKIIGLYHEIGETPPDALTSLSGGGGGTSRSRDVLVRDFPLENIEIISRSQGGDGRTVEAYAAVFDSPAEIKDRYGHYIERINRSAFNMSVNSGAAKKAECLYNHGYNPITRRPDVVASIALGTPLDVRVEKRGLLTVTRYNTTPLAEATLCAIKDGQITGQSFEGPCFKSDPMRVPAVRPGQALPVVTRMELGLRNYGPTPMPAYNEPMVTVVRSIIGDIKGLSPEERQELIRALTGTSDEEAVESGTTTSHEAGAEEPRVAHSGRLTVRANAMAMELALMGFEVNNNG